MTVEPGFGGKVQPGYDAKSERVRGSIGDGYSSHGGLAALRSVWRPSRANVIVAGSSVFGAKVQVRLMC